MEKGDKVKFWVNTYKPEYGKITRLEIRYGDAYAEIKPDKRESPVYLFRHGEAWRFEPLELLEGLEG